MMRMRVSPDGGEPYELEAASRDVVAWEKAGRDRAFSNFAEKLRMSDVYALAHVTARRMGRYDGSLEAFEATCDIDLLDDDEAPDPTLPGP